VTEGTTSGPVGPAIAPTENVPPVAPARDRPRARRRADELTFRLDDAYVERLAAGSPDWLAEDRRSALARFRATPLETNQLYTPYLDLRNARLEEVEPQPRQDVRDTPATVATDDIAASAAFEESDLHSIGLTDAARRAGVTVEPLTAFVGRAAGEAQRLLTNDPPIATGDALAELARAGWNQGVVVRVPSGARLDRPIVVRWTAGTPGRAVLTRTIIELGDGAEASFVEELVPPASTGARTGEAADARPQSLFAGTTEVRIGAHARLGLASLQELGPDTVVFQSRTARIGEGADLRWALAQLGGRLVRSRVDNVLIGDRSTVEQTEIVFGTAELLFDLTSYTRHRGRDTTGHLLSKGVLLDESRTFMKGMITIEKTAVGTDSFLGEFGMNLSKKARAVAIPSLEIDQPDCRRAAHSSSVGPIDETQLFYLESRGIPPAEARKFIVLGFLEPVVVRVPLEDAQDRLRDALDAKWEASFRPEADAAA